MNFCHFFLIIVERVSNAKSRQLALQNNRMMNYLNPLRLSYRGSKINGTCSHWTSKLNSLENYMQAVQNMKQKYTMWLLLLLKSSKI